MKNSGFTLIETVVSIFILTILFSVGVSISKLGSNLSNDIKNTAYVYEIQNLISYGKAVCKYKNKNGKITIDSSENEIRFVEGWDDIEKTIKLPKEFIIVASNSNKSIPMDSNGKMTQGNTITLFDKNLKKQEIIIRVGVDLIRIDDGNGV